MSVEDWGCGTRHVLVFLLLMCDLVERCMLQSVRVSFALVDRALTSNFTLFDDPYQQMVRNLNDNQKMIYANSWHILTFIGSPMGGWLTMKVNLKWLLFVLITIMTSLTYAMPHIMVDGGYDAGFITVLLMGLIHGMKDPVLVALLAQWVPQAELGRSVSLVFTSSVFTNVITIFLYIFFEESQTSWTALYYLMGNLGVLWSVSWFAFGSPTPRKCFYLSARERIYITKNLYTTNFDKKDVKIPWKDLFAAPPFYGVLIPFVCYQWIYTIIFCTGFPQAYVLSRNKTYSAKTFLLLAFVLTAIPAVQFVTSIFGDLAVKNNKYPTRFVRKTLNSIAFWGGTVCLTLVAYDTPTWFDIMSLCIFTHVNCFYFQGAHLSFFDVDRTISGFIYGLVGFFGLIPTAFVNHMTVTAKEIEGGYKPDLDARFDAVWFTGAVTLFFGNFFYIILASDESKPMVTISTTRIIGTSAD